MVSPMSVPFEHPIFTREKTVDFDGFVIGFSWTVNDDHPDRMLGLVSVMGKTLVGGSVEVALVGQLPGGRKGWVELPRVWDRDRRGPLPVYLLMTECMLHVEMETARRLYRTYAEDTEKVLLKAACQECGGTGLVKYPIPKDVSYPCPACRHDYTAPESAR